MPSPKLKMPKGLTGAAQKARAEFMVRYDELVKLPSEQIALNVLVWGPGDTSSSPVKKKRAEIRTALIDQGHNAMFSEELTSLSVAGRGLSEKAKEFAQAEAADLIIILVEGSPGASGEMHDFSNHPKLAPKVLLMIPKSYRSGYSAKGAVRDLSDAHGGVYWYGSGELSKCTVLTKALTRAEGIRRLRAYVRDAQK